MQRDVIVGINISRGSFVFSQSRVKVSARLTSVGSLAVEAFDLVNCSLSVVRLVPVLKVTSNLRGCPLEKKKIRTRAVFKETPTNYISTERLKKVEFDKIMFCFGFYFLKAVDAVNSKMTD